jgi:carbon monoxide dehydrogenase subunit G
MSFRIEESFELRASVDTAWRYLADPRQVVNCLPGAELTEIKDDATYLGRVKVKVGPVTAAYDGKVTITSRDDAAHVVSMVGEGREKTGSGSAKMTMTSRLTPISGTLTQVQVTADVDIVGKAAQFGRGMVESVNKQLFKQFTECVRGTLEGPSASLSERTATDVASSAGANGGNPRAAAPSVVAPTGSAAQPVHLLPLLWDTFLDWLKRITSVSRA